MSTDELERLVAASLRVGDAEPVDLPDGRVQLGQRISQDHRAGRRRSLIGVAAAVLAIVVTTSLLLAGRQNHDESQPIAPPKITLSPSGLPVGWLVGKVTRSSGVVAVSTVGLRVYPGGQGTLNPGTTQDTTGGMGGGFEVAFERLGPGRVAVRYDGFACPSHYAFTMTFRVRGRTLTVLEAQSKGCIISAALAHDLAGTTFRVLPLPENLPVAKVALSPSGLPVGLLEAPPNGTGHTRLLVRILVRADGSGQFSLSSGVAFDVTLRPDGPGRATLVYDNPALADPEVVTLSFTVRDQTVTIGKVDTPGTGIISKASARSIAGTTLRILRAPPTGQLCCRI